MFHISAHDIIEHLNLYSELPITPLALTFGQRDVSWLNSCYRSHFSLARVALIN